MTVTSGSLLPVADDAAPDTVRALLIAVLRKTGPIQLEGDELHRAYRDLTAGRVQLGRTLFSAATTWAAAIEKEEHSE